MIKHLSFIIIGAAKAGTTSLYHYLNQHPEIYMSPVKETNYWLINFTRGKPNLKDLDVSPKLAKQLLPPKLKITTPQAYAQLFSNKGNALACGEASPLYMHSLVAPKAIKTCLPAVKLIAILRNPVDRAYSDYQMRVRKAQEKRSFLDGRFDDLVYLKGGFYFRSLSRYFETFPRDRIKVIMYEDLCQNPILTLQKLFLFLGVSQEFIPDISIRHNLGGIPKQRGIYNLLLNNNLGLALKKPIKHYIPIEIRRGIRQQINQRLLRKPEIILPETRKRLLNIYEDDIRNLQELIQVDLSKWLIV